MEERGFYFAFRFTEEIGLSFAAVYNDGDFQLSLMLGCMMLAIGYRF